jgi:hypothetical protein
MLPLFHPATYGPPSPAAGWQFCRFIFDRNGDLEFRHHIQIMRGLHPAYCSFPIVKRFVCEVIMSSGQVKENTVLPQLLTPSWQYIQLSGARGNQTVKHLSVKTDFGYDIFRSYFLWWLETQINLTWYLRANVSIKCADSISASGGESKVTSPIVLP